MKLKFRCRCKQKLRAPVSRIGGTISCASCAAEVVVPPPTDPHVIEITCRCETTVDPAKRFCSGCGLDVVEAIEGELRDLPAGPSEADEGGEPERAGATPDRDKAPPGGPIEIPPGFSLWEKALVKFFCSCGKKVRLKYKQRKDPGVCPRCKALLVFPDVTREPTVTVLCACETPYTKGVPESGCATPDHTCRACGKKLLIDESTPVPPHVEPSPAAPPAPESVAPPPAVPAHVSPLAPVLLSPVPTPPPSALEVPPPAAPPKTASGVSDRSSQRRRMKRAKMGATLVFALGLGLISAAMIWFFRGGTSKSEPEGAPPEKESDSGDAGVAWDPSNPLEPSSGGDKDGGAVEDPFSGGSDSSSTGEDGPGDPEPGHRDPDPTGDPDVPDPDPGPGPGVRDPPPDPVRQRPSLALRYQVSINPDAPPVPQPRADPGESGQPAPSSEPDPEYFAKKVQPLMKDLCMTCHANQALPTGKHKMRGPGPSGTFSGETSRRNYESTLVFVNRADPLSSPFLLKPLAIADGGTEHGGGDRFKKSDDAYAVWVGFLTGDRASEAKPIAVAGPGQEGEIGEAVHVDGSASRDPVGKPLGYLWEVVLAPPRSSARVANPTAAKATFRPDEPGAYLVSLVVIDSTKTRSDPRTVVVQARAPLNATQKAPKPQGAAREEKIARVERLYRSLLGRAPAEAELARALEAKPEVVAGEILARHEFWSRWYEAELAHLGLSEDFRPREEEVLRLPARLANGETAVLDAFRRILTSEAFARRYPRPEDAVTVLYRRLLGAVPSERELADAVASPLGAQGLPGLLMVQEEFYDLYVLRHRRRLFEGVPSDSDIESWGASFEKDPASFPSIVAGWALGAS